MKIKIGGFSGSTEKKYVWVRLGGSGEYEKLRNPRDAGVYVGRALPAGFEIGPPPYNYRSGGIEILPHFAGLNYISLFWGDEEGGWIRDLGPNEKHMFEYGIKEGLE